MKSVTLHAILCIIAFSLLCDALINEKTTTLASESGKKNRDVSGTCGENISWSYDDRERKLTITGKGDMYDSTSSRSTLWETRCFSAETVVIEEGVTSIGNYSFSSFSRLKVCALPKTLTKIGKAAFQYCGSLTNITIPASVSSIATDIFNGCGVLASIDVEEGNTFFRSVDGVLFNSDKTRLLLYPPGSNNETYRVPDGVACIEEYAFAECKNIRRINIAETVESIKKCAFYHCSSLVTVDLPSRITSIEESVFQDCRSLSYLVIPENVTSIGKSSFHFCRGLKDIIIPSKVTAIGECSFCSTGLLSVQIPASVSSLARSSFGACNSLTSISVEKDNKMYSSKDGVLFNLEGTVLLKYPENKTASSYTVPDGVVMLEQDSFNANNCLINITIPDSVTTIGANCFKECQSLTNVNLPPQLTSIEDSVFYSCAGIKRIVIPDRVTTIGSSAFMSCESLKDIVFSKSLTSISNSAFYSCNSLTSVVIPSTVKKIESIAFYSCSSLTTVSIPASVTSIGSYNFNYCPKLTFIDVDENNQYYKSLDGVFFDHQLTTLLKYPPAHERTSYTIPDGVVSILDDAFFQCSSLTNVVIPESVTSIQAHAFRNCASLSSVFYQGSQYISSNCFHLCSHLENVCVAPEYEDSKFCGVEFNSSFNACKTFQNMFNRCFKANFVDGAFYQQMRINASEWEKRTNGCKSYFCDNETGAKSIVLKTCDPQSVCYEGYCNESKGDCEYSRSKRWKELAAEQDNHCFEVVCDANELILQKRENASNWENINSGCFEYRCDNNTGKNGWSLCNSSDDITRICVENQCIEQKPVEDKKWIVEIKVDDVKPEEMNTTEVIASISELTGMETDEFTLGYEVDENGVITRVIVYVNNEEKANIVATAVDEIDKGDDCAFGTLCSAGSVKVTNMEWFIVSLGSQIMVGMVTVLLLTLSLFIC